MEQLISPFTLLIVAAILALGIIASPYEIEPGGDEEFES